MIDTCVCDIENKLYENGLLETNARVKFTAGSIAVIETYKNEHYHYHAININTGKRKLVSKRKFPLDRKEYELLAHKVQDLEINQPNINSDITRYERAKNLLCHIFSYILPAEGFTFRKNQLSLSLEMLSALETNRIALMEAEVGTGKTHAYMLAVILYNLFHEITTTSVISTSTIALQKAITEEYIPQISDILLKYRIIRKPIRFIVRKGKLHYVCDMKLKTYLASLRKHQAERDRRLMEVLNKLSCAGEQHIDLDAYPLARYVKERIHVTNKCNELCSYYDCCRFISFTKRCLLDGYDFQIVNHNYVFADVLGYKPLLPTYGTIIFDEAHKLYDVAKQMYGCYLLDSEFAEFVRYVEESKAVPLSGYCIRMKNIYPKLFLRITGGMAICEHTSERHIADFDGRCIGYIRALISALTGISDIVYSCDEIRPPMRKRKIKKMSDALKHKLEVFQTPDNLICWWEYEKTNIRLASIPKELSQMIYKDFWDRGVRSVLTSGTLSANDDFALLKNKLGLDFIQPERVLEASKSSPFDYKKNAMIYIPEYLPFPEPKNAEYVNAITKEIERLLRATYGHSLVLFTSYRLMEIVFHNINQNHYDYPLFIMGRGRIDALKDFKISGNGVLFASDAAGEGIDIAGDTLSNLIVVKLPFAVPDPITQYEQSVMGGLHEYLKTINTPNMIIKLKQYVGRLIRSESDTGVVAILDSRASSRGKYRNIVLKSLFDAAVTNSISDVEWFIFDKKDIQYYITG